MSVRWLILYIFYHSGAFLCCPYNLGQFIMRSAFSFTFILLGSNQRWLILNSPFAANSRKPDPCCTFSRREMRSFRPQGNTVQCRVATCVLIQGVFLIFCTKLFSSPAGGAKKKASRKTCFFLSNPKDWHVISRKRVCNRCRRMASRISVYLPSDWFHTDLRSDSIPQQVADYIHAFGVIFCKSPRFWRTFVFLLWRGQKCYRLLRRELL